MPNNADATAKTPIEENTDLIAEVQSLVDNLPEAGGTDGKYAVQFVDITTTEEVRYIQINESLLNYFVSLTMLTPSKFYVQVRRNTQAANATSNSTHVRGTFIGSACYYDTATRVSVTGGIGTPVAAANNDTAGKVVDMGAYQWAYQGLTDIGKGLFIDAGETVTTDGGTETKTDNVFPVGTIIRGVIIHDKNS